MMGLKEKGVNQREREEQGLHKEAGGELVMPQAR